MMRVGCIPILLALMSGMLFGSPGTSARYAPDAVSVTEDLMREHGILNRIFLIYQEIARRLNAHETFPVQALQDTVKIVRNYLELYHEKIEEEYVYPPFIKADRYVDVISSLIKQHQAGKKITDYLLIHSSEEEMQDKIQSMVLAGYLDIFCRMFRPHEARETTELYPSFHEVITSEEYYKLTPLLEAKKQEMFGENGYQKIVEKVADIEKQLGTLNLSQYDF